MPRQRGTTVAGVERRDIADGEHDAVADGERGVAAAVDELARVRARSSRMEGVA